MYDFVLKIWRDPGESPGIPNMKYSRFSNTYIPCTKRTCHSMSLWRVSSLHCLEILTVAAYWGAGWRHDIEDCQLLAMWLRSSHHGGRLLRQLCWGGFGRKSSRIAGDHLALQRSSQCPWKRCYQVVSGWYGFGVLFPFFLLSGKYQTFETRQGCVSDVLSIFHMSTCRKHAKHVFHACKVLVADVAVILTRHSVLSVISTVANAVSSVNLPGL